MRGKAVWCLVAAGVSLSALRPQIQGNGPYRETVEEFRANADAGIGHLLDLPDDVVARGVEDAARPESLWPLQARGAALVLHTDAALYLVDRSRTAAWVHINRARTLADALARDPESAWIVHQWFIVVTTAFKDDTRVKALIDHWHAQPWYPATSAMERGLDHEGYGSFNGPYRPGPPVDTSVYMPEAFGQAADSFRPAIAAHLEIAAVHLGRIEMLRGHADEARRLFGQATYNSHWRTTIYLANLFLGSMDERDGDWTTAERRYRKAVEEVETAQSGRLALAAFLGRRGRGTDAARVLTAGPVETASFGPFDPWWSYLYPYSDRLFTYKMILAELYVAVSR